MNNEINDKLFSLIDSIENNKKIIRMKELNKLLKEDKNLNKKLDEFYKIIDNPYSDEYVELKKDILENVLVKEYKQLEKELNFIILEINSKLKSIVDKKECSN